MKPFDQKRIDKYFIRPGENSLHEGDQFEPYRRQNRSEMTYYPKPNKFKLKFGEGDGEPGYSSSRSHIG